MAVLLPGKFLFLAHPHTASNSMMFALTGHFEDDAVDLRPHHLTLRDLRRDHPLREKLSHYRGKRLKDGSIRRRLTPDEIRQKVSGDEHIFSVVRNPYDFLTSCFVRQKKTAEFVDFVRGFDTKPYIREGTIHYHADDSHTVLRFENLQPELDTLFAKIGLPQVTLGTHNVADEKNPWESYYTPAAFRVVNDQFGEEIERFHELRW
jgi:hypothetical protein